MAPGGYNKKMAELVRWIQVTPTVGRWIELIGSPQREAPWMPRTEHPSVLWRGVDSDVRYAAWIADLIRASGVGSTHWRDRCVDVSDLGHCAVVLGV